MQLPMTVSIIAFDMMALGVCMSALFTLGSDASNVAKLYIVEGFLQLAAFSMVVVAFERLFTTTVQHSTACYNVFLKSRDHFLNFISIALKPNAVRDGDRVFARFDALTLSDAQKDPVASTELVPSSTQPSQSGTPTFNEACKEAGSEDACSAATTM